LILLTAARRVDVPRARNPGVYLCARTIDGFYDPSMTTSSVGVSPYVRELSATLLARSDELGVELAELIRAVDIRYRDEHVVSTADLVRSCSDNIELIFSALAGLASPVKEGPRETGRRRAEQGMPLAVTLRGYRIGGRFVWNVLVRSSDRSAAAREALLQAAEVIWAVIDDYSEALSDAFRDAIADQSRRDTQVRTAVLGSVLDGTLGDGPALWEAATTLGLPLQGTFLVVAAETRQTADEPLPRVEQALRGREVGSVWRLDADRQVGVLTLPREGASASVCAELGRLATARVGVSERFSSLATAPRALRQARVACLAAAPDSKVVLRYEDEPVAIMLASAPEAGSAFAQSVLGPVLAQPAADRELLLGTLRSWFAQGASTSAAAEQLFVHRNTVRYRLRRVEELTGRSLADPAVIGQFHFAMEAIRNFRQDRESR
jgi:hypothetical protein